MATNPKPVFPKLAATLPGEADILAKVIENFADFDAKLVYADWLQEHDDDRGPLLRDFVNAHREGKKLPATNSQPKPWCDLVGITLIQQLRRTELKEKTNALLALALPTINYKAMPSSDKSLTLGASKFGGCPDLPDDEDWPANDDDGPLSFFGQFNLAELQASPVARELPAKGLLSVFAFYQGDGDDDFPDDCWRMFYFPDVSKLERRDFPAELEAESRFPACRLQFTESFTLPSTDSPWSKEIDKIVNENTDEEYHRIYWSLAGDHILGHPFPIQSDFLEKKSNRHLLTINGCDATGWEFGDGGALYFTLAQTELRKGNFKKVKMFMDCG
jgi:uncharacterized protein (TIGR02996 family)